MAALAAALQSEINTATWWKVGTVIETKQSKMFHVQDQIKKKWLANC